jgi:hypothetical protein
MRGQLWQCISFGVVDCSLTLNGEVNPAMTTWALADEADIAPPSAYQRIMNRAPKRFEAEVDGLETLLAA